MTTRQELAALKKASDAAHAKVKRNAHKLAWLDATRREGAMVILGGHQLADYEAAAAAASKAFRDAIAPLNWTTDEIVVFLTEIEEVAA